MRDASRFDYLFNAEDRLLLNQINAAFQMDMSVCEKATGAAKSPVIRPATPQPKSCFFGNESEENDPLFVALVAERVNAEQYKYALAKSQQELRSYKDMHRVFVDGYNAAFGKLRLARITNRRLVIASTFLAISLLLSWVVIFYLSQAL